MSQYVINIGALPNDGTGDPLRTAFNDVNLNFDQVFAAGPVLSNIQIANNTILTTNTNGNLVLAPNGIGAVVANVNILPNLANTRNLGSSTLRWASLYTRSLDVTGVINLGNVANLHISGGTNGYVLQTDGTGNLTWVAQSGSGNGSPGGANTQVQFNDDGLFSGVTAFTFDQVSNTLSVPNVVTNTISSDDSSFITVQDGLNVQGDITANDITANAFIGDGSQLLNIPVGNNGAVQIAWLGAFSNQGGTPGDTYSTLQFDSNGMPTLDGTTAYQQRVDYSPYLQVLAPRVESTDFGIVAGPAIQITGYADDVFYNTPRSAYLSVQDQANATQQWDFGILGNGSNNFSISNRTGNRTWTFGNVDVPDGLYWPDGSFQATAFVGSAQYLTNPGCVTVTTDSTGNTSYVWTFGTDGSTIFPTLTTQRGDNPSGTISGQTLLFGDATQEAIISTPDGSNADGINSQRLVINPGKGEDSNGGEGGDIYLWAGRGGNNNGSGGDVKIRGGYAPADGTGGYIRMDGGESQGLGDPGFIEITGGQGGNTSGGYVQITGGVGGSGIGGAVDIIGGFGQAGPGADVTITGGGSANGLAEYGNVNISAGASTWTFDNTGNLTLPSNTSSINYANGDPYGGSGGANTGNVTFSDQIVIGTGISNLVSGLYLAPSSSSANAVQYLRVRGDVTYEPTHIHFDTGNNQYFNQFIGDDNKYVLLSNIGDIVIRTDDNAGNSAQWTFGADGNLTVPGNIFGSGNILIAPDSANSDGYLDIYLTTGPDVHVASNGDSNLILGRDDSSNVTVNTNGNVTIQANTSTPYVWTFDSSGNLRVPQGGYIGAAGVKGDGTMLTGGKGNITSLTSFYSNVDALNYSSCVTVNADGTLNITTYGDGTGQLGQWNFANTTLNIPANGTVTTIASTGGTAGNPITIQAGTADQGSFSTSPGGNLNLVGGLGGFNDGGGGGPGGNVNITAGNSSDPAGHAGNVTVNAGTNTWNFDYTGQVSLPGGTGYVSSSANTITIYSDADETNGMLFYAGGIDLYASGDFAIFADNAGSGNLWRFYGNSLMTTPGGINSSGNISATGNVTGGNISAAGNVYANNIGNVAVVNLNGNVSTVLSGDGTWVAQSGASVAEAAFIIKSADFVANVGARYGVDTTGNTVTATLPVTPSTGGAVFFADAGGAYATNNLIINPNGATIMGDSGNLTVSTNNQSVGLFYNGTTWRTYNAG